MELIKKEEKKWTLIMGSLNGYISLVNSVRQFSNLSQEIIQSNVDQLLLEVDLAQVKIANSELISQLVTIQSEMIKLNGRLKIINANPELRSTFDIIMLDKVINISYMDDCSEEK